MSRVAETRARQRRPQAAVIGRLRGFHADSGGQISLLAVFGLVALVGLLGMVMTTGDQVSQKIQMQNSVDAAALSGGAWIARGLNVTSAFNLMETQLAGGAILLLALDKALPRIQSHVRWQNRIYTVCAIFFKPCVIPAKITKVQLTGLSILRPGIRALKNTLARCPGGLFWLVAKGLEYANSFVHWTFYFIATTESYNVARASGAEAGFLVPGPIFHGKLKLTMPTKEHPFSEHCHPMEVGSPGRLQRGYHPLIGYPVGEGPYRLGRDRLRWIAWILGGVPPFRSVSIYNSQTSSEKNAFCYGGRCGNGRPKPYLLDAANDGLSYLAVAYKPNRKIFFRGTRVDQPPDLFTYAQVEIYNGVNGSKPDAYTQDWRVRLAPASLIEQPFEIAAATEIGSALVDFGDFVLLFFEHDYVDIADYLWQVGNH